MFYLSVILYWFKVPHWVRGNESAVMISPRYHPMAMLGLGSSIGTPPEGVTADVLVVTSFDDLKAKASKVCMVEGAHLFVLVHLDKSMIFRILFFFFYLRYHMICMTKTWGDISHVTILLSCIYISMNYLLSKTQTWLKTICVRVLVAVSNFTIWCQYSRLGWLCFKN